MTFAAGHNIHISVYFIHFDMCFDSYYVKMDEIN